MHIILLLKKLDIFVDKKMKRFLLLSSVCLLVGCSSLPLPQGDVSSSTLPASEVVKNFDLNANVLRLADQLQQAYSSDSAQVLRIGNQIKVTFASDALFGVGGEVLLADSQESVNPLIQAMKDYPEALWRVDCFTDTSGSAEVNVVHSIERAQSLVRYLVAQGVMADKISFKGYGGAYPVAANDSVAGRALNRRVVVTISHIPVPAPQPVE